LRSTSAISALEVFFTRKRYINPHLTLTLTVAIWDIMGTAMKHPVPDRVKPSYVIFDIQSLRRSGLCVRLNARMSKITWRLNPVWHRMLYSCTHMATVGVKGLTRHTRKFIIDSHIHLKGS